MQNREGRCLKTQIWVVRVVQMNLIGSQFHWTMRHGDLSHQTVNGWTTPHLFLLRSPRHASCTDPRDGVVQPQIFMGKCRGVNDYSWGKWWGDGGDPPTVPTQWVRMLPMWTACHEPKICNLESIYWVSFDMCNYSFKECWEDRGG